MARSLPRERAALPRRPRQLRRASPPRRQPTRRAARVAQRLPRRATRWTPRWRHQGAHLPHGRPPTRSHCRRWLRRRPRPRCQQSSIRRSPRSCPPPAAQTRRALSARRSSRRRCTRSCRRPRRPRRRRRRRRSCRRLRAARHHSNHSRRSCHHQAGRSGRRSSLRCRYHRHSPVVHRPRCPFHCCCCRYRDGRHSSPEACDRHATRRAASASRRPVHLRTAPSTARRTRTRRARIGACTSSRTARPGCSHRFRCRRFRRFRRRCFHRRPRREAWGPQAARAATRGADSNRPRPPRRSCRPCTTRRRCIRGRRGIRASCPAPGPPSTGWGRGRCLPRRGCSLRYRHPRPPCGACGTGEAPSDWTSCPVRRPVWRTPWLRRRRARPPRGTRA